MERFEAIVARTLNEGGATFDREGNMVTSGYAVAQGWTKMLRPEEVTADNLAYLIGHMAELSGADTFGTWYDDGWVWVETSKVYDSEDVAAAVAEARNEIAYFNITDGEEVRL